jgi:hypothetical protein
MSQQVKSFHDLVAWQKARELVTEIYKMSQKFPKEEIFGLTSQIRRATVSIPSNIAEGRGKSSPGEFQQFLQRLPRGSGNPINNCHEPGICRIARSISYH